MSCSDRWEHRGQAEVLAHSESSLQERLSKQRDYLLRIRVLAGDNGDNVIFMAGERLFEIPLTWQDLIRFLNSTNSRLLGHSGLWFFTQDIIDRFAL
jgi:hypothetical protein